MWRDDVIWSRQRHWHDQKDQIRKFFYEQLLLKYWIKRIKSKKILHLSQAMSHVSTSKSLSKRKKTLSYTEYIKNEGKIANETHFFSNYYIALWFANDGKIARGQGCKLFFIVLFNKDTQK